MLGTFAKLKAAIKLKTTAVRIATPVFKLHYQLTFIILVASSILVTSRQYIGEHINCIQDSAAVPAKVINNYCFISATFSIPRTTPIAKGEISLFGLGSYTEEDDVVYHAYYQWWVVDILLDKVSSYNSVPADLKYSIFFDWM